MKISAIVTIFFVNFFGSKAASLGSNEVMVYLSQYGYVSSGNLMNSSRLLDGSILKQAIEEFQSFAGLAVTGEMDEETESVMKLPRCGVKDKVGSGSDSRSKRYALQGSRWKIRNLSYRITKYPVNVPKDEVDNEIQRAFDVWSDHTDLTFKQMRRGSVNIEIKFEKGEHGDGDPFDGPGGTLAHAYFPVFGGDVHFDAAEQWTINKYSGTNLFQVAAHEIGHSLGLSHTDVKNALMAPFYRGYQPYFVLDSDDISGIQRLYGGKTTVTASPPADRDDKEGTPTNISPDEQILCKDPKIDAIFQSAEGNTYVFKGNQYWRLNDQSIDPGYPKLIASGWPGLPGDISSAFTYKNGKTYFFKGTKYWRYNGRRMDGDYPKDISSGFAGIPDDIDAAMVWSGNGKIYFFKGSKFWRFDPMQRPPVKSTYPKPISNWEGIPNNLDDAFQYSNGYTYFYKNGAYYRFNDRAFAVDAATPAFPRSAAYYWFGCQSAPTGTIGTPIYKEGLHEGDDDGYDSFDAVIRKIRQQLFDSLNKSDMPRFFRQPDRF
ncbi:matrix metalloproteinase-14 isoform X2 [Onthophagus taurus]|uniref:matrix metalloproteinase-14 isoform X2 n=1 Tax=Onthophagus taurus TaxID=166361 RepID=UPI0039BDEBF5